MIKLKLLATDFHTLFPYKKSINEFKDLGIEIIEQGDSYDYVFIGHSCFSNKKVSLQESTEKGLEFLSKITGKYFLVDGQDSPSVIGTFEVFKESCAIALLKHSLWKNRELYNDEWIGGRYYWGKSEDFGVENQNYKPDNFAAYSDRILLSGTNWLGTVSSNWLDYKNHDKLFDVSAMFGYPHPDCHEHGLIPSQDYYYNQHRKLAIDILDKTPFMIAKLRNGKRLEPKEYFKYVQSSKITFAPFGYGEMAPRDIESAMLGSILIKPSMEHIDSKPFIYKDGVTYIACKHDYSDLEEKIVYCLDNYEELRNELVTGMRIEFDKQYHPYYLAEYTKELISNI